MIIFLIISGICLILGILGLKWKIDELEKRIKYIEQIIFYKDSNI